MIHPILVHFPVALLTVGLLFDLGGWLLKRESLRSAGWWCMVFGVGGVLLATLSGVYVEGSVGHNDAAHDVMELHKKIAFAVTALFSLLLAWRGALRAKLPQRAWAAVAYFAMCLLAVGLMGYGAHLGGTLVYEHGVGSKAAASGELSPHTHDHSHDHSQTKETTANPPQQTPPEVNSVPAQESQAKTTHVHADGKEHSH
jgi:uncharacterized membrane protein